MGSAVTARDPWAGLPPTPVHTIAPTEEEAGRAAVFTRSGGDCERCGTTHAGHWHHRKTRGRGGTWSPANGLQLCHSCHDWVHRHPEQSCEQGFLVRTEADPATTPVLLHARRRAPRRWVLLDTTGGRKDTARPC